MLSITSFIKNRSVQTTIIAFILVFTILAMLISVQLSGQFMSEYVMDGYLSDYLETFYSGFDTRLSIIISQLNMFNMSITAWQDLYLELLNSDIPLSEKQAFINTHMTPLIREHSIIEGVDIITADGAFRCSPSPLEFSTPIHILDDITRSGLTFNSSSLTSGDKHYIAAGAKFYNFFNNYDLGYIILYFNENVLFSIYKNSILENSSFFITSDDYIISHSDKSEIGSKSFIPYEFYSGEALSIKRYETSIISRYTMPSNNINSNVCMVAIISGENLYSLVNTINLYLTVCFTALLTIAFILVFVFTKKLLLQYTEMRKSIEKFGNDPYSNVEFKASNEVRALEISFSKMVKHIRRLMEENDLANKRQREAELKALQIHINPHFIYNALDIITCMAKINGEKDIEETTYALASFFRIGLSEGENCIPISEEINHVKSYIYVERMRFPDLFDVEYDIPGELSKNLLIVKITLQPLVENSIKHGFRGIKYRGKIRISLYEKDSDIHIEVTDNGTGIKGLSDTENPGNTPSSHFGFGLKNVRQRLELEYGKGYGITFSNAEGGGTTVTVKIKKIIKN